MCRSDIACDKWSCVLNIVNLLAENALKCIFLVCLCVCVGQIVCVMNTLLAAVCVIWSRGQVREMARDAEQMLPLPRGTFTFFTSQPLARPLPLQEAHGGSALHTNTHCHNTPLPLRNGIVSIM